jgi:hypothetical protein
MRGPVAADPRAARRPTRRTPSRRTPSRRTLHAPQGRSHGAARGSAATGPRIVRCLGLVAAIWLLGELRPIAVVEPADAFLPPAVPPAVPLAGPQAGPQAVPLAGPPASVLRSPIQPGDPLPASIQPTEVRLAQLAQGNELPDPAGLPAALPDPAGLPADLLLGLASGASPLARDADPPAGPGAPPAAAPLAAVALRYVGAPYRYGGADPSGFDCSGFVFFVSRAAGRPLPRTIAEQAAAGPPVAPSALQAGDLVFFADTYTEGLSHSGIYVGGGQFVHAGTEATGVVVSALANPYWASHWHGAIRAG